jgi:hypothetical protein
MMQSGGAGEKISMIELVNLTPEDLKKATTPMDGPTGKVCLNLKPTKKLVIKVEKKDAVIQQLRKLRGREGRQIGHPGAGTV